MSLESTNPDLEAFARVNASMASNPGLAKALLKLLEEVGDDPRKIDAIRKAGVEGLETAQDKLPAVPQVDLKQAFIEKYGIQILSDSQVVVTLPEGTSRVEFLKEAQAISSGLHGQNAVVNERLAKWENDSSFNGKLTEPLTIAADARMKNSNNLNRDEMECKGWLDLNIQDLAVAHTAYFIATGKDAFQGDVVRALGGALYFFSNGLDVGDYCYDAYRFNDVSASRSLPSPN